MAAHLRMAGIISISATTLVVSSFSSSIQRQVKLFEGGRQMAMTVRIPASQIAMQKNWPDSEGPCVIKRA